MRYYLGLDNGGTMAKAVLFDENGRAVASAASRLVTEIPHEGWATRDMEALWQENCQIIRLVLKKSNINPKLVRGLSFSGHGKGLYLVGENGKVYTRGIISTDSRAYEYVLRWKKDQTAKRLFERNLQGQMACQPICLLKWIQEHQPEVLKQARWIFGVKDYIRYRLTGKSGAEITDFSGSGLLNLRTRAFDREILSITGLDEIWSKLPPLVASDQMAGYVTEEASRETGLAEGTVCAGGLFDIVACALGMDLLDVSRIALIVGTWGINEYISPKPVVDGFTGMNSLYCLPGYYLIEESSPTSASNLEWFIQATLLADWKANRRDAQSIYAYADCLAERVGLQETLPVYLPYLYGSNTEARAHASFVGLSAAHTHGHMIRSVLEGIVFCHRQQVEQLLRSRDVPSAVRLGGGVCNSPFWVQMFADVLNLPIELASVSETGALGAAMTAAVACKDLPDLQEAARRMVHNAGTVFPNPDAVPLYQKKYTRYCQVERAISSLYSSSERG